MKRSTILTLSLLLLLNLQFNKVVSQEDEDDYDYDDGLDEEEGGASEEGDADEKDVVVVTSKNWSTVVGGSKFALVEFYAPWCGHCKALKPEYAQAATSLKAYDGGIVIGKVDATVETELADKHKIEGYPTLKWFVDGEEMEYNGGRDEESIVRWVKKKTGPAAVALETLEDLEKLESSNEVLTVGYFENFENDDFKSFISAAQKSDDSAFAQTTNSEIAKKLNLEKFGVSLVRNNKDENRTIVPLSEEINSENILKLINAEKLPLVITFSDSSASKIFNSGIDFHMLIIGGQKLFTQYNDIIYSVAKTFRGKIIMVLANTDEQSAEPVMNHFDLEKSDKIQVVGLYMEKSKKFYMDIEGDLAEETAKAFAQGMVDGTLRAKIKSEAIPENNMEGSVVVVVGDTVDTIVKDSSKDVLLEIYAPWCGHCKQLAPIYQKLGKRFASVESVVIAKMDGRENEHPDIEVEGYPTIKFFPACNFEEEGCDMIDYDGERSLPGFTKFIQKNALTKYELPKNAQKQKAQEKQEKKQSRKEEKHEEL